MYAVLIFLVLMLASANAFIAPALRFSRPVRLHMSSPDPMSEIRAKMAADPNYNPLQDPQAMQVLESQIPAELKELPNALERLRVAFKDATSGPNAVPDLNAAAASWTGPKTDLISSPTSDWMKNNMPNENPSFDEQTKKDLYEKVKSANPDVPLN